jgi:hypothetical protein
VIRCQVKRCEAVCGRVRCKLWEAVSEAACKRPVSVYRLGEMPIQSCGQSVSAPHGKAGVRLNAHTELRAKRQRSAWEAIYRNRPIAGAGALAHQSL